jgi:hypothetical protein
MIAMLKENKQIDWNQDIPLFIKHGIYCKKKLVEKEINGCEVLRSEYVCKQFKINFSDDNLNMLISKYWTDNLTQNNNIQTIILDELVL